MIASKANFDVAINAWSIVKPVAEKLAPEQAKEMDALFVEKTSGQKKPSIMLYGMYSHGKSTLVNALLGRNVAEIGRSPTTTKPDPYFWEGGSCTLLDTPGIQARVEDTRISEAERRKCELIAFVVESGAFEADIVWRQLAEIVASGQKACLVINDFDQCIDNQAKGQEIKDKFRTHLQHAAREIGFAGDIVAMVPMLICNARRALKARLEGKKVLLEKSGLPELEQAFVSMAASISLKDCAATLARSILALVGELRRRCALEEGNESLSLAEENLTSIKLERERAWTAIAQELDTRVARLAGPLQALFEQNDKEQISQGLSQLASGLGADMAPVIEREIKRSASQIEDICRDFSAQAARMAGNVAPDGAECAPEQECLFQDLSSCDWSSLLGTINFEGIVKEAVFNTLKQLKSWLPSLFAGKGVVTLGRWAGYAASAVGFVLAVVPILLQMYSDYKAQQEAEDRARRRAQAIADVAADTQSRLRDVFLKKLEELFGETFDKLAREIEEKVASLRRKLSAGAETEKILAKAEALLAPEPMAIGH